MPGPVVAAGASHPLSLEIPRKPATCGSIPGMKLSVSLPDEDVEFMDSYGRSIGAPSRSAVLQEAVRLLREAALAPAYLDAWQEWEAEGSEELWDSVSGDGLDRSEPR